MKPYRLAILRKEFPFLDLLFTDKDGGTPLYPEQVDEIKIRRGDSALLNKVGIEDIYDWSGGGHYNYTTYFAICGEEISELANSGESGVNGGEHKEWTADSIGEQLFSKRICPEYIIECVKNDTDDNGNGRVSRFWTIYKMSKFDLSAHHQSKIDQAASALKAEIAAACQ